MNFKPILIVAGEPNSIFLEIYFKSLKQKIKSPIILIGSYKILILQMKKLKFKKKIKILDPKKIFEYSLNNKSINLININYNQKLAFEKISAKSNRYIKQSFDMAIKLIKKGYTDKLINGPISKKTFLKKEFLGITEYLSKEFSIKDSVMLIYSNKLSVCPITTHLPIKLVSKQINKKTIIPKIEIINKFFQKRLNIKPKIGILGLNPHCESILKINEDEKITAPIVDILKKRKINISGPYPADTIFLKKNRRNFDVIVGMYHDQVLTPIKTLVEYNAINITLGLPFIRISPDHGPNENMLGKNKSNPLSLIKAILFLDKN